MNETKSPKLRGVDKYKPDYPLGQFPPGSAMELGKELIYLLATRNPPTLEGSDWEQIFEASCITVGLFDTDSGVKRCEHGAQSAECLQRAA